MSKTKVARGGEVGEEPVAEVEKLAGGIRRIRAKVAIAAHLETIWDILTAYDRLTDIIPSIVLSKLIEKRDNNCFRVHQVVRQSLPLGIKFSAKMVLDFHHKGLESLENGTKRVLEFNIVEGDFQSFDGVWSIQQAKNPKSGESAEVDSNDEKPESILLYSVDLKPSPWLPFHLIEGRICNLLKTNLTCVMKEAEQRTIVAKTNVACVKSDQEQRAITNN